jgi:hypothetical protein
VEPPDCSDSYRACPCVTQEKPPRVLYLLCRCDGTGAASLQKSGRQAILCNERPGDDCGQRRRFGSTAEGSTSMASRTVGGKEAKSTSRMRRDLRDRISRMWAFDGHEHLILPEEHERRASDCFYLTNHYLNMDLVAAGMPEAAMRSLVDTTIPLDARWASFAPFWEVCRTTGYGIAVDRAIKLLYDLPGLSTSTYRELSERVAQTAGRPEWYEHVLKEEGRIVGSLMDVGSTKGNRRYFLPVMRLDAFIMARDATSFARAVAPVKAAPTGADAPATLGAYLQGLDRVIDRHIADGAVGFKCGLAYRRSIRFEAVDRVTASRLYEHALAGSLTDAAAESLQDFLFHEVCDRAGALGVPYQIHTGLQNGNWGADIVLTNPVHLTNTLKAHPTTRFDLFHGGYPYVGELATLAKNFPNAYINACWLAIISPTVLGRALHEWLDTVPHSKIQAFGGDYHMPELACAHGHMAREVVGSVLADRVEIGLLEESDALTIADRLLRTNGISLFKIPAPTIAKMTAPLT